MKDLLVDCVRAAGHILLRFFGADVHARIKDSTSSIVTDADIAAEQDIVRRIRDRFPDHSILAEETGYARRASSLTWVIDPLDGTSNFAAGLPWFGVQIAVLDHHLPLLAAMYLPVTDTLYVAERGGGVQRDGQSVRVTAETQLSNVLCAFGLDAAASPDQSRRQAEYLRRVSDGVRNIRATNCLLDFGYTLDGRLGAAVNLNTKIWDIAPAALMFPEAGGRLSELTGDPIVFRPDTEPFDRSYAVAGASQALHPQLIARLVNPSS